MRPARVLVVYESLFGNTRDVAVGIAAGMRVGCPGAQVECVPVDEAPSGPAAVDLLVVGGPTHLLAMTSRAGRFMEREYEQRIRPQLGRIGHSHPRCAHGTRDLRGWLADLPTGPGTAAVAFDTRMGGPLAGGAAPGIARRLRRRGYRIVSQSASFAVERVSGPPRAGELERATAWGEALGLALLGRFGRAAPGA